MKASPSKIGNWALCPRFDYDENGDRTAAEEGTMLHDRVQTGILDGLEQEQKDWVESCRMYLEGLNEKPIEGGHEVAFDVTLDSGLSIRGRMDWVSGDEALTKATVLDWKFGRNEVDEAEDNLQGISYAVALFHWFPSIDTVSVGFVYPRLQSDSRFTFTRAQAQELETRLLTVARERENPFAPPRPHTSLCGLCAHRAQCPAMHGCTALITQPLAPVAASKVQKLVSTPVSDLDPREKGQLRALVDMLMSALEQRKNDLTTEAKNGAAVAGYKMVHRKGNASVTDAFTAELTIRQACPEVVDEDLRAIQKFGFKDLCDLLKLKKGMDAADVEDFLGGCITRGQPVSYLQKEKGQTLDSLLSD